MRGFQKSYDRVMHHEGGYANHPADHGGETYRGISRRFHPAWPGWVLLDEYSLMEKRHGGKMDDNVRLQAMVKEFYKAKFWDIYGADMFISYRIAAELFEAGVNVGQATAAKWLQRAVNVSTSYNLKVDGKCGPATRKAINDKHTIKGAPFLVKLMNVMQGYHYLKICEKDPTQRVFLRGWVGKRVALSE